MIVLAHLLHKIFRLLLDVKSFKALLMQLVRSLLLKVTHLTLEVLLDVLILSEFDELTLICLHLVPSSVIVDHTAPESVLLFLLYRDGS